MAAALARIPLAKPILAIKGMSTLAVAGILGEAGDLSGYAHGHALLRHAGLNLAEASSGKWKGQMSNQQTVPTETSSCIVHGNHGPHHER
ncbi:transposase [Cohnella nanjingensis]|uniref:Transposase n=2 Tax=Cohnella nanjingensis TaxID=1387779 RepID=A0A7X0RMZ8_9BACL|nr:transposase [Cohnella nanjingensis]